MENPSLYGFSEYFTITYLPSISIHSPLNDTVWNTGKDYKIQWTSTGVISSVDIHLYETSTKVLNIVEKTSNDGLYYWTIPNNLQDSAFYRILIVDYEDVQIHD